MENHIAQLCVEYLEAIETIRKSELLSTTDIARELDIAYVTLKRIQKDPTKCALKTLRKLKRYVDDFNDDHMDN